MRRKDREMDMEFALEVMDRALYGVFSFRLPEKSLDSSLEEGFDIGEEGFYTGVYSIPVSIVRINRDVYFHSAQGGMKTEIIQEGFPARLVAVGRVEVPELYTREELDAMADDESQAHQLARRVFTTQYESAIACGRMFEVTDEAMRSQVLTRLCEKYCPGKENLIAPAIRSGGPRTRIYGMHLERVTAKRKWYDGNGKEMKGRSRV